MRSLRSRQNERGYGKSNAVEPCSEQCETGTAGALKIAAELADARGTAAEARQKEVSSQDEKISLKNEELVICQENLPKSRQDEARILENFERQKCDEVIENGTVLVCASDQNSGNQGNNQQEESFLRGTTKMKFFIKLIGNGNRDHAISSNRGRLERFI